MTAGRRMFIIILTLAQHRRRAVADAGGRAARRAKPAPSARTTGHVWDDDLPSTTIRCRAGGCGCSSSRWSSASSTSCCIRASATSPGTLGWTSHGRARRAARAPSGAQSSRRWRRFAGKSAWPSCAPMPRRSTIGRNLFAQQLRRLPWLGRRGAPGFPNLTDKDWLWGGEPDTGRDHDQQRPHRRDAALGRCARRATAWRTCWPTCCQPVGPQARRGRRRGRRPEIRRAVRRLPRRRTRKGNRCSARRISPTTSGCTAVRWTTMRETIAKGARHTCRRSSRGWATRA